MESIIQFRQMMAEQKYFEVQKLVEAKLVLESSARLELLKIYFDVLAAQEKSVPLKIIIELIDEEMKLKSYSQVLSLIDSLSAEEIDSHFLRIQLVKINIFESLGRTNDLYLEVSKLLIKLFEKQIPVIPHEVNAISEKYFKNDFHLNLLRLSFSLLINDTKEGESLARSLILNCYEKASFKGRKEKLKSLSEVLRSARDVMPFRMYQVFCEIAGEGIAQKSDIKRIVEMVIYFEDFIFQVLVLNLVNALGVDSVTKKYADEIKKGPDYNFVYFDKYFPELKKFFVKEVKSERGMDSKKETTPDLTLEERYVSPIVTTEINSESIEGEELIKNLIRYQDFTSNQLCDLAVGFIQSNMPDIALIASKQAIKYGKTSQENLKGSYLKLNAELMLQDYRAALDTALSALNLAVTEDDILSFMYGQAEALIRLDDKSAARKVLKKILEIDSKYRLAKERLEKLNEI